MDFGKIIALIDQDLDRLQQARAILANTASFSLPEITPEITAAKIGNADTRSAANTLEGSEALPVPLQAAATRRTPRPAGTNPRRSRAPRKETRAADPLSPGALRRPVDERPVFVPANKLSARATNGQTGTARRESSGDAPSLTAESLAQRWISNALLP